MSKALCIAHGAFGRVALLDMDCSLVRHAHPHCHVLLKVEGADTQFQVDDAMYPLTDRAAVLVNGWQPHSYVHVPDRPRTLILALYIEPEWLQNFRPGWVASGSPGFFNQPAGELSPRIRSLAINLATDMMVRPDCRIAHEKTLSDLMISVIERFAPWRSFPASLRELRRASETADWRIRRVITTMRRAINQPENIDGWAKQAGLSRAHFFRLFESTIGVPPKVYMNVLKLERAVSLVLNRPYSLCEISSELGFAEPAHFTRFFRNHAGVGPREFRNVSRLAH
ncbi:helix-turn-helix transcriptional regulator [Bradyrhizobium jicamae]|uniref:Helix-turn-helix transcriptional regulator n=1 Tax=Bradyrhizobium jicamae TaxID=280332 RepID=A0ABS5FKC4_9BRAD|nr:AraC family transcriptional regulator [Bradyrhizobium jicamae]MBR0797241.1 helix-turn-helix transcriptional regulator [Bradyrhizobium jicamae]MBR0938258.1 helix-turn-helix transcriptional regulator [Bradyrhizobium jicamae]